MLHKIGTLYLNGRPAAPGSMYESGMTVSFGPSVDGHELYWKPIPNTTSFILAAPALLNISWRQLRDLGFVNGKSYEMDGNIYMVRLPRLGIKPPVAPAPLEGICFWGQETFIGFSGKQPMQLCPIGSIVTNSWGSESPAARREDLGFVPVIDKGI